MCFPLFFLLAVPCRDKENSFMDSISAQSKSEVISNKVLRDCAALIESCAAHGDLVNTHDEKYFKEKLSYENSLMFTEYDEDNKELLGCLLLTDKDYCNDGYEYKDFLLDEISRVEGIELIDNDTRISWISAVCTNPSHRKNGCATRLFSKASTATVQSDKPTIVIAEAVRETNDVMLSFSERQGFKQLPISYTEHYFGDPDTPGADPWKVLYKFLRRQ